MQFSFEVDPNLDTAIGLEADFVEANDFDQSSFASVLDYPLQPTDAKPGSEDKVRMLSARYAAGLPLWHDDDCYDHGPDELNDFDSDEDDLEDDID